MLQEETQVPVFFTHETQELLDMYSNVASSANTDHAGSAAEGKNLFSKLVKILTCQPYFNLKCYCGHSTALVIHKIGGS